MRLPLHGESSIGVRCDDQLMDEPISARSWRTSRKNKHNSRTKRNRSANRSTRIHDHRQKAFHPSALLLVSLITLSCVTRLLASRVAFFFPRFAVDKARSETKIRPQRRGKRVRYRSHRMHDPPSAFLPWNFFFLGRRLPYPSDRADEGNTAILPVPESVFMVPFFSFFDATQCYRVFYQSIKEDIDFEWVLVSFPYRYVASLYTASYNHSGLHRLSSRLIESLDLAPKKGDLLPVFLPNSAGLRRKLDDVVPNWWPTFPWWRSVVAHEKWFKGIGRH